MTAVVDTAGRLRRLLAILAWLAQVGEAPIDEVAARFDLSPRSAGHRARDGRLLRRPSLHPGPADGDRGHRHHGVHPGGVGPDPTPAPQPVGGIRPGRLGPRPAGRSGQRRHRGAVPGAGQARSGARGRGDRRGARRAGPPPTGQRGRWSRGGTWPSPTTRRPPTGSPNGRSCPSASSGRKATGTSMPGASRPAACGGSGSTASARPSWSRTGTRRSRRSRP